jgi:hypothetical protein
MSDAPQRTDHEYFEELCAFATAGALTATEADRLFAHLNICAECTQHFADYQSLATEGMPQLADFRQTVPATMKFDPDVALRQLLERVNNQTSQAPSRQSFKRKSFDGAWRGVIAASVLLGVGLTAYHMGRFHYRHPDTQLAGVQPDFSQEAARLSSLESRLSEAEKQRSALTQFVTQRTAELERLQTDNQTAQSQLKELQSSLETTKSDEERQLGIVAQEKETLQAELRMAEQRYTNIQDELNRSRHEKDQNLAQIAALQAQVAGLTVSASEQSRRAKDDEQYLASDKDIRDLIGARNLYIADIMDVREDGSSRKPFGRVFYTKTKSLIFYAYDLDKQPGVKQASTFHVWGRTGPNDTKPLNLGILYLDSETSRRWALRVDNPEQLSRLDSVFVTIETRPQTDKPTGKPFLYASLRREPNHP